MLMMRSVVFYLACSVLLSADDWPRFRGPNGTGVSTDRGLPDAIDQDRNVLWSVATPKGHSSPIVVGGRIFLTGHEGDERIVLSFNAATGEQIWSRSLRKARSETFNPLNGPTTPTPATDGRNIFVFFPELGLVAFDRDGVELWRTPLGPFTAIQGLAASPVYVDGAIVLLVDTPEEAYIAAFNAETGELRWRTERPTGVLGSYATPTVHSRDGDPTQIVVAGSVELTGYETSTGKRLWWAHGVTVTPSAPPFVAGDSVYTVEPTDQGWPPFGEVLAQFDGDKDRRVAVADAAGDTVWARSLIGIDENSGNGDGIVTEEEYAKVSDGIVGGGLSRTRVDGRGDVSETHVVWRHIAGMPSITGALLYEGVLFVVRNAIVSTFDPETGKRLRRERIMAALGDYYASPVAGDGKIYLTSLEGKVTVLKAGADWQILTTGDLGEQVIATPAIANGCIFFRTDRRLYGFGGNNQ